MHAEDLRALHSTRNRRGMASGLAGFQVLALAQPGDEALARRAKQNGAAEAVEQADAPDQRKIVDRGFAKANAGVYDDPFFGNSAGLRVSNALREVVVNFQQNIFLSWIILHRVRFTLRVHQAH